MAQPDIQAFILYVTLIQQGPSEETHYRIESLVAEYPEIYDLRLVLGISYLLQGQRATGQGLVADMPEMGRTAPRYVRVAAAILGHPLDELVPLSEREYLLPRERFLISLKER